MNETREFWKKVVQDHYKTESGKELIKQIKYLNKHKTKMVPQTKDVYRALTSLPKDQIKVLILGQDPYPTGDHANGLAFASKQKKTPVSLKIIFDIINYSYPKAEFKSNDLQYWANQGVLLLNTALTCISHKPGSMTEYWQPLVLEILQKVYEINPEVFVITFGKPAQALYKAAMPLHNASSCVYHPSYMHRVQMKPKDMNQNPFSEANLYLNKIGEKPIDWSTK